MILLFPGKNSVFFKMSLKGNNFFWEAIEKRMLSNLQVLFENRNKKWVNSDFEPNQEDIQKQEITVGLDLQFDEFAAKCEEESIWFEKEYAYKKF